MRNTINIYFTKVFIVLVCALFTENITAQSAYKFWVELTDKNNSRYSVNNPSSFLSERAIQRRTKQNINIDETDLPVSQGYINQIEKMNFDIIYTSKWFNAIVVGTNDSSSIEQLKTLSFVKNIELAAVYQYLKKAEDKFRLENEKHALQNKPANEYGYSFDQIHLHNGDWMHNQGYNGKGMHIAIIDAGFRNADIIPAFDSLWINNKILGHKEFVNPIDDLFKTHSHGTNVLSIIGTNVPNEYVGTAPQASFWLLRSEDGSSEMRIEEMNWIAAAEFADSAGVDVINTSLGYSVFDIPSQNYTYEDMTGEATYVSRAAEIAASKGMLLVTSAGNEGDNQWKYITSPADADHILTVGAINIYEEIAPFSSVGPSFDGRVKPDIVSVGWSTALVHTDGRYVAGSGTSFSAPMITGLVSCLWQAFPFASSNEIIEAVRFSSDRYNNPDDEYGYGIPDFKIAYERLESQYQEPDNFSAQLKSTNWGYFIEIRIVNPDNQPIQFDVIDMAGRKIKTETFTSDSHTFNYYLNFLKNQPIGVYLVNIKHAEGSKTIKVIR